MSKINSAKKKKAKINTPFLFFLKRIKYTPSYFLPKWLPMETKEFKRHCRNLYFYVAELARVEEEIKLNDIYMSKPRGPRLEVIGAPAHDNQSHIVDYIQKRTDLEAERQHYLDLIETIESIRTLPSPWNDIFWETLVLGKSVRPCCKEADISKDMYYRKLAEFTCHIMQRKRRKYYDTL